MIAERDSPEKRERNTAKEAIGSENKFRRLFIGEQIVSKEEKIVTQASYVSPSEALIDAEKALDRALTYSQGAANKRIYLAAIKERLYRDNPTDQTGQKVDAVVNDPRYEDHTGQTCGNIY